MHTAICYILQKITSAHGPFRIVHHWIISQHQCQFEHCSHVEPQVVHNLKPKPQQT
uniref:Uncharacterized protein n=1 Tax=Arundo donax TaxID=35708 RepID=A0A0A8ZU70_ARUDO